MVSAIVVFGFVFPAGTYAFSLPIQSLSLLKEPVYNESYDAFQESSNIISSDSSKTYFSQNIPLLAGPTNPNLLAGIGGADINIVDGNALLPSAGPSGTNADIIDSKHKPGTSISIYVVRKGDTLSEIAQMYGVSVNTIRWANDLGRKGTIRPGQELVILPITGVKYTIKRGGTLRDVIKKIGGDLEEAAVFNDIDPDKELAKGTELIIPNAELQEPKKRINKVRSYVRSYGTGLPVYKGYYMRPIKGGVKTQNIHGKNAVDLASTYGSAIYAAADGKVIISKQGGWNGGYGTYLVIKHPNGTQTLYSHNSRNLVKAGDYVKQGQIIATVGSSGKSTGPHVHFEIRGARNPF